MKQIQWNLNRNSYIFIEERTYENVVWKMAAILFWPQYVKSKHVSFWVSITPADSLAVSTLLPGHPEAQWSPFPCPVYIQDQHYNEERSINTLSLRQNRYDLQMVFLISFLWMKLLYFDTNFTEMCSQGPINNKLTLVQILAWHWTDNKLLYDWKLSLLTNICISQPYWFNSWNAPVNFATIGSDNDLLPSRRQAITLTNAGILSTEPLGTYFSEIWIKILQCHNLKLTILMKIDPRGPFY